MWTWWYAAYNSFLMAISNDSKFQVLGEIVVLHFSFLSRTSLHNNPALKHGHIHMIEKQTPWPEIISNDPMTCDTYLITACQAEKKRSSNNLLSTSKQNQIAVCFRGVQGKMCLVEGKKRKKNLVDCVVEFNGSRYQQRLLNNTFWPFWLIRESE